VLGAFLEHFGQRLGLAPPYRIPDHRRLRQPHPLDVIGQQQLLRQL
jgi:hypothetical protein